MPLNKAKRVRVTTDLPKPLFWKVDRFCTKEEIPKSRFMKEAAREKLRREGRRRAAE